MTKIHMADSKVKKIEMCKYCGHQKMWHSYPNGDECLFLIAGLEFCDCRGLKQVKTPDKKTKKSRS